jgi:hypothetical protein
MMVKIAANIPAMSTLHNSGFPFEVIVGVLTNGKIKMICEPTKTKTEIPTPSQDMFGALRPAI